MRSQCSSSTSPRSKGTRALGRGGDRQDDPLGGRRREAASSRYGRVLTCRGVEAEASLSFAGLSELLAPVFDEAAASLVPPRRRALEVALLLVEPGDAAPDAHAIGLAVLDVLRVLAERRSGRRRARRSAVARSGIRRRAPDRAPAPARRARRTAGDGPGGAGPRQPGRARALVRRGATRAALDRPAQPRRAPPPARGAARARR